MNPVTAVQHKLNRHLTWNKARLEFLSQFILSLIKLRTCSLYRLCVAFQREADAQSNYKRIQRFFRSYVFYPADTARLLVTMVPLKTNGYLPRSNQLETGTDRDQSPCSCGGLSRCPNPFVVHSW